MACAESNPRAAVCLKQIKSFTLINFVLTSLAGSPIIAHVRYSNTFMLIQCRSLDVTVCSKNVKIPTLFAISPDFRKERQNGRPYIKT